ncbi:sortase [Candidatus Saccharibacteria bacterium]|nr:sortase [Candidatus Saccharibacteria bacterium]
MGSVIRKHKLLFAVLYLFALAAYLLVGFQPSMSSAAEETAQGRLIINSISLSTPVQPVELKDRTLDVPDEIAGSFSEHENKIFLFGHSATVFKNLKNVKFGDIVDYGDHSYKIINIETRKKSEISMLSILKSEEKDTVVLMTCSGENLGNGDFSHRLIITAEAV